MNVLYLTANPNRASSNVPTEGWFTHLRPRGLAPVLASPAVGTFQTWARESGIPVHVVPLPFPDVRRPAAYLASLWRLRRVVRRHRIDLVHAIEHTVYPIAGDLARVTGVPVVVGVHSRIDEGFATWAFGRWRLPTRLFFLTVGSQESCRQAVEPVVPEDRWRILRNGIDIERFEPDDEAGRRFRVEQALGDGVVIGAASWLRPGKQLEHLARAAAAVAGSSTLILAGGVAPGEEAYAAALLDDCRRLLGTRFRYAGNLSELRGFYNALDFYVNTSKEEASGISVMESLACGTPVLGYPSVCIDEQVLPGGGEITPQDDERALADAIGQWVATPERYRSLAAGARQRALSMFDVRRVADDLWREYASITAGG